MRKIALLSASALVLALGVASASAEPRTEDLMYRGNTNFAATAAPNASVQEGRAAALDSRLGANVIIDQSRHAGR